MTLTPSRRAALLFVLEYVGYFIVTLNMRAVADTNYLMTFITDILIASIGFTTIKQIIDASTLREKIAYVIGGALGAQTALWTFSHWL